MYKKENDRSCYLFIEETDLKEQPGGMIVEKWMCMRLKSGYTVEAAGVMSAVLLTIMILLTAAFRIHKEVWGSMRLHTMVEQERHAVSSIDKTEIYMQAEAGEKVLTIIAPVFRPENSLRMWSLLEAER